MELLSLFGRVQNLQGILLLTLTAIVLGYQKKKMPRTVRRLKQRLKRLEYVIEHSNMEDTRLLEAGRKQVEKVEEQIRHYNDILSQADEARDRLNKLEREAMDIHERILLQVGGLFGRDSMEYEHLGGVRRSNINYRPDLDEEE